MDAAVYNGGRMDRWLMQMTWVAVAFPRDVPPKPPKVVGLRSEGEVEDSGGIYACARRKR